MSTTPLQGWVIIWVRTHTDYPTMTSNIVDEEFARRMASEMLSLGHASEILAVCSAEQLRGEVPSSCPVPPPGWRCTRDAGHEGPCAALPV